MCDCDHDHEHKHARQPQPASSTDDAPGPAPLNGLCGCEVNAASPEVWPEDAKSLGVILENIDAKIADCQRHIKALTRGEDPENGVFYAQQIHKAKQLKVMLRYQRDLCAARLKSASAV